MMTFNPDRKFIKEFKLQVNPYRQTLPTGCGSSCIMMVGNHFLPEEFPLVPDKERIIHEDVRYNSFDVENGAKMIKFLRRQGFKVIYFLNLNREIIPKAPPGIDQEIWDTMLKEFFDILKEEKESGLEIYEDTSIERIREEIIQKKLVICEIQESGFITHSIVIRGFRGNFFYCLDPLASNVYRRMLGPYLDKMMNITYGSKEIYGRNFISVEHK
jgi:hypothetical protein